MLPSCDEKSQPDTGPPPAVCVSFATLSLPLVPTLVIFEFTSFGEESDLIAKLINGHTVHVQDKQAQNRAFSQWDRERQPK